MRAVLVALTVAVALAKGRPNIMVVVADDLGYNDVPWHNPAIIAPHLHHLADQGVVLEQNYVQPKCAPSRLTRHNRIKFVQSSPLASLKTSIYIPKNRK